MEVVNRVIPNKEQIEGFLDPTAADNGPIYMVNLLKYKEKAEYEDGRESTLTGEEAYRLYANEVSKLLVEVGGFMAFKGDVSRLTLGEVEELWDDVAIAMYPSRAAMLEMMQLPKTAEISAHRSAGLAGQLNIETISAEGEWIA